MLRRNFVFRPTPSERGGRLRRRQSHRLEVAASSSPFGARLGTRLLGLTNPKWIDENKLKLKKLKSVGIKT